MRRTEASLLVTALLLAGCSLAPDYHRPAVGTPAAYKEAPDGWTVAAPAADAPRAAWWEAFGDPLLNGLEARIEAGSPSLAAAVARYDEAVGSLHEARADLLPEIARRRQRRSATGPRPIVRSPRPGSPRPTMTIRSAPRWPMSSICSAGCATRSGQVAPMRRPARPISRACGWGCRPALPTPISRCAASMRARVCCARRSTPISAPTT